MLIGEFEDFRDFICIARKGDGVWTIVTVGGIVGVTEEVFFCGRDVLPADDCLDLGDD
jgi:hypothetical protein